MNNATKRAVTKIWESALAVGHEVTAVWSKRVFGTTYTYRARAIVTTINSLHFQVTLLEDGGDTKVGKAMAIPRFLNPRRCASFCLEPLPR